MVGKRLAEQRQPISILFWGREGEGKTTHGLHATKGGRVLLIDAEAGAKIAALRNQGVSVDNIDVWPDSPDELTFAGLERLVEELREELEQDPDAYYAVMVDSFTEVARRMTDLNAADSREKARQQGKHRDRFQVDLADHGTTSQMMRWLLRRLRDLPVHLIITALERRDQDDDGKVAYGPAVGPAVGVDLMGLVDIVGWATHDTITDQNGRDETFRVAVFAPMNKRRAKDRYGMLPIRMVTPTFDRVLDYIEGRLDRDSDTERARLLATMRAAEGEPETEPDEPDLTKATGAQEDRDEAEPENPDEANEPETEPQRPVSQKSRRAS